jgi:replicative DNA helicase
MELFSEEQIAQRLRVAMNGEGAVSPPAASSPEPKYVRNLSEISASLIEALQIPEGIGTGLFDIDNLTRGFRPSDLVIVTGFAHSGKTQLINQMIVNNPAKRVLFFTLDDPAEMILAKLVAMTTAVRAEFLEAEVRSGNDEAEKLIRRVAEIDLPNLLVVDTALDLKQMKVATDEAIDVWGAFPDAIIIDYLEMIPGAVGEEGETVKKMANKLKRWAGKLPCPLIVLHQGTRSNSKPGAPITLLSMGHSGEQQATIVIGVRRRRDSADEDERIGHDDTITVHIVKNKRPGGRCTSMEGINFHLEWETGVVSTMTDAQQRRVDGKPPAPSTVLAPRLNEQSIQQQGQTWSDVQTPPPEDDDNLWF